MSTAGHLGRHGLATVLTVVVMGLALALPLALNVLVRNVRAATGDFSEAVGLSVYLKPEVSELKARQLAKNAAERTGVASATLITASEALAEFRTQSGFGTALDSLPDNPLPNVLTIRPAPDAASPTQLEALRSYLLAWPEVDSVQLDRDWVLRFSALLELLRRVVLITALLLGAGVIAVVGNTIRLEILNRRNEIEVTKLVGGTNAFVRRPFLYAGVLYGILAGADRLEHRGAGAREPGTGGAATGDGLWQQLHARGSGACANWECCCWPAWCWAGWAPGLPPPASWRASSRVRRTCAGIGGPIV